MRRVSIAAEDGLDLFIKIFDEVKQPKQVLYFIHGMSEHSAGYQELVDYFVRQDIIVVCADLRGHKDNLLDNETYGYFGENGEKYLLSDQLRIINYLKETFSDLEISILAHSFGTVIMRNLLKEESIGINKIILTGPPVAKKGTAIGDPLCSFIGIRGDKKVSNFLTLMFLLNLYAIPWKETLNPQSYDYKELEDPSEGFPFTINGYRALAIHMTWLGSGISHNPNSKLYLLSGEFDITNAGQVGIDSLLKQLNEQGFKHLSSKIYQGKHHGILKHFGRFTTYEDIFNILVDQPVKNLTSYQGQSK